MYMNIHKDSSKLNISTVTAYSQIPYMQPILNYCLDLLNHRIENLLVNVNFDRLNGPVHTQHLQVCSFLSSFKVVLFYHLLYFPEESMNNCFFVKKGCTIF